MTRTPLLETKLCPAISAAAPILREQLALPTALCDGQISVVTVTAPAGYGKSTLMAQWQQALEEQGVRTAWLNLDEDDSDTSRFARYLTGALARGGLDGSPETVHSVQESGLVQGARAVLESLAVDLNELKHRLVLFIDDVHFVHGDEVLEILRWLVNYAPTQLQFVLGSREEAPLPLGRLRVRRKLQEYGLDALKFDADEAALLMASRLHQQLDSHDVARLVQRTEGWPAGLELAGLILDGASDQAAVVDAFAGNDQNVMDYLGEELLDNLDRETRELIFVIAQFNRVDGALAVAASQNKHAARQLEAIHARNLFLKRMDVDGRWYRFHHLVGHFFREQGERQMPEFTRTALVRGAQHLIEQGLPLEAIHCAMRAEEWNLASRWLSENVEELVLYRGYVQTIQEWMKRLPSQWADRYPYIHLSNAFALMLTGQPAQARQVLDRLVRLRDRLSTSGDMQPQELDQLDCAIGMHEAHAAGLADQMEPMMRVSSDWVSRWPHATAENRGSVANVLAFAHKCYSQIDQGLAVNADGKAALAGTEAHYLMSWNLAVESYLHLKRGDFTAAEDSSKALLDYLREHLTVVHPHAGHGHAVLAFIYYERDDIALAREHIESIAENDNYTQADFLILHYLTRARLHRLSDDAEAGFQCLARGRALAERFQLSRAALTLATEQLNWLCRDDRLDEARELAHRVQLDRWPKEDEGFSLHADKAFRVAARLHLQQQPGEVANKMDVAVRHSRQLDLRHRQMEWLILQALAWQQAGKTERAQHALTQALMISATEGYVRSFLDEGLPLLKLLQKISLNQQQQAAAHLLSRLLKPVAGDTAPHNSDVPDQSALIEELTKRELQILQRLQSDLSNREIAEAIFVSEGTLKWHLHNIYGKLGVKNRSGALSRGLELSLL